MHRRKEALAIVTNDEIRAHQGHNLGDYLVLITKLIKSTLTTGWTK